MIQSSTTRFLSELKEHNHKEWMDEHRGDYEAAKRNFEDWVQAIIDGLAKFDPTVAHLSPKECTFRINRDIRFSKDKSPYKTNFGAAFVAGGKKSPRAGYYFHLAPGASFAGGGMWMPEPSLLKKVRQEIDYGFQEFGAIVNDKPFKQQYGTIGGEALVKAPQGYEPHNPAIEYLKMKSFTAIFPITDVQLKDPELLEKVLAAFKLLKPFNDFLNRAVE
ncbi:MAG: DUF2461 domain-containing protein [Edaphocola sp.]